MKAIWISFVVMLGTLVGILYFASPLKPEVWQVDAYAGLNLIYEKNDRLSDLTVLNPNRLPSPEDIVISDDGYIYTGLENGDIVSFPLADPDDIRIIANTAGRPLGIRLDAAGKIIVADAVKGLLAVSTDGQIEVLVDKYEASPLLLVNHLDIAKNGEIYFSNSSARYDMNEAVYDFIETSATGGIFRYSPNTKETIRLMDNLFFANGLALGPNDEYLLISETGKARIHKLHLSGVSKGQADIFTSSLPAMPDNISFNGIDVFWVGMVDLRDSRIENLAPYPFIRRLLGALPIVWFEPDSSYGFVLGFDLNGEVVANLQTEQGYTKVSAAYEHNNKLYLGSLLQNGVGVYDLK